MFIKPGFEKPAGLRTEHKILELERTDGSFAISSSVRSKELRVPFIVVANNLEEATYKLNEISQWLGTPRSKEQVPKVKDLVFDWDKDLTYEYVLEDQIEANFNEGRLECSVLFKIPDGVGWTETKKTGATGINRGLVGVRPKLRIVQPAGVTGTIRIIEEVSGQELFINHEFSTGSFTVDVDCRKRSVEHVYSDNTYTDRVSYDSDWFYIRGNYKFVGEGCEIIEVEYREGY